MKDIKVASTHTHTQRQADNDDDDNDDSDDTLAASHYCSTAVA